MRCIKHLLILIPIAWAQLLSAQAQGESMFDKAKRKAVEELKKYPNPDTNRVNALINVFTTATYLKERQEVLPYRLEAMGISRRLNYLKGIAFCYSSAGHYYKSASRYEEAITYFDSVLLITANTSYKALIDLQSVAHERIGSMYFEQGNYYAALDHFFEALKYPNIPSNRTIRLNISVTDIYLILNNLEKATDIALKNIVLVERDTAVGMRASVYFSYIDISLLKRDLASANEYLDKIAPEIPHPDEIQLNFGYYMKRGELSYLKQDYDNAYSYFREANKYAVKGGHRRSRNAVLRYLSNTALKMGDREAAREHALANIELAEAINTTTEKVSALVNLSEYYKETGNKARALELMEQAMRLKDSTVSEANVKQMNILGAIYEAEKQDKEINRLEQEKDRQTADARHKSVLNWIFIGSITVLLILGYLGYTNFKRGQQLARQEQTIQQQRITQLEKDKQLLTIDAMLKGQEEERNRIAKDLHDGLGSLLSGVKLSFMNIRENMPLSPEQASLFDKSLSLLDHTIGDLRKVAHNIMPEGLARFGLPDTLRDFCESIQSSSGLKIVYQHYGEMRRLDNTAEVFIYRIIQELVNNALRHAGATEIIVQLVMNPGKVVITVEDNGRGFDPAILALAKGSGMTNIRHRMQYFNGTMDLDSAPGQGTSVNIELMV